MKKKKVNLRDLNKTSSDTHKRNDAHNQSSAESIVKFKVYVPAIFSFVMLIIGIAMDYFDVAFFKDYRSDFSMESHIISTVCYAAVICIYPLIRLAFDEFGSPWRHLNWMFKCDELLSYCSAQQTIPLCILPQN